MECVYRCNNRCPIGKYCFIIKTVMPIDVPVTMLYKGQYKKRDIRVSIGGKHPP